MIAHFESSRRIARRVEQIAHFLVVDLEHARLHDILDVLVGVRSDALEHLFAETRKEFFSGKPDMNRNFTSSIAIGTMPLSSP